MDEVKRWRISTEQLKSSTPSIVIVLSAFIIYSLWAMTLPFGQTPDEIMRFDVPLFIAQNGMLPNGFDEAIRDSLWGTSYAFSPYGSSLFAALFMSIASFFTSDMNVLLFAARLVSVFSSTGTVALCLLIGKRVFKSIPAMRYLFAILVGFLPQLIFLSSYFNCDAFAVFSTAMIFYAWVRGLESSWDRASCIVLGIGLGLCLLSYYNAYAFILLSIFVFFGSQISFGQLHKPSREFLKSLGVNLCIVVGITLAIAAWFFIRNAFLYDGDFLGLYTSGIASELYAQEGLKPSVYQSPAEQGMSLFGLLTLNDFSWTYSSRDSFIGLFGYMEFVLPPRLYQAYYVFFFIVFVLAAVAIIRMARNGKSDVLLVIACVACMVIPLLLSIYYSLNVDLQAQGRYLMTALLPLMFLATYGLYKTLEKFSSKRIHAITIYTFSGVYLVFASIAFITTILPNSVGPIFRMITL